MVRSTIQRLGTISKPTAASGRVTISTLSEGRIFCAASYSQLSAARKFLGLDPLYHDAWPGPKGGPRE
jgi:hypothetical protein